MKEFVRLYDIFLTPPMIFLFVLDSPSVILFPAGVLQLGENDAEVLRLCHSSDCWASGFLGGWTGFVG